MAGRYYLLDIIINVEIKHTSMEWQVCWLMMSMEESVCLNIIYGAMAIFGTRLSK